MGNIPIVVPEKDVFINPHQASPQTFRNKWLASVKVHAMQKLSFVVLTVKTFLLTFNNFLEHMSDALIVGVSMSSTTW